MKRFYRTIDVDIEHEDSEWICEDCIDCIEESRDIIDSEIDDIGHHECAVCGTYFDHYEYVEGEME